jgi:biopolymer transport protein ExbD
MKLRKKSKEDIAIDMSPMIDMVFLLLIFFIVASQIVKVDKVPIELPAAVYAKVPEDETGRYTITVTVEGDIYVGPASEQVTIDELKERVASELEADKEFRVMIRADGDTEYEDNEKIMEACGEVGAIDMIFAVFEE